MTSSGTASLAFAKCALLLRSTQAQTDDVGDVKNVLKNKGHIATSEVGRRVKARVSPLL